MPIVRRQSDGGALAALAGYAGQTTGTGSVQDQEFARRGQDISRERGIVQQQNAAILTADANARIQRRERRIFEQDQERRARRARFFGDDEATMPTSAPTAQAPPVQGADPTKLAIERIKQMGENERALIDADTRNRGDDLDYQANVIDSTYKARESEREAMDARKTAAERRAAVDAYYEKAGREKGDAPYLAAMDAISSGDGFSDQLLRSLGVESNLDRARAENLRAGNKKTLDKYEQGYFDMIGRGQYKTLVTALQDREKGQYEGSYKDNSGPATSKAMNAMTAMDHFLDQAGLPEIEDLKKNLEENGANEETIGIIEAAIEEKQFLQDTVEIPAAIDSVISGLEQSLTNAMGVFTPETAPAFGSPGFNKKLVSAIRGSGMDPALKRRMMTELERGGPIADQLDAQLMAMNARLYAPEPTLEEQFPTEPFDQ